MTRVLALTAAVAGTLVLSACLVGQSGRVEGAPPPIPVASVDLQRYQGLWYEIARYPTGFQSNCQGVTAEYVLQPDGQINVINTCRTGTTSGRPRSATAAVSVIDGSGNARIAVNFAPFPLPKGDGNYWVLHLAPDYSTALVGSPSGRFLWMLARTPRINTDQRAVLEAAAVRNGYRLDLLEDTEQP